MLNAKKRILLSLSLRLHSHTEQCNVFQLLMTAFLICVSVSLLMAILKKLTLLALNCLRFPRPRYWDAQLRGGNCQTRQEAWKLLQVVRDCRVIQGTSNFP